MITSRRHFISSGIAAVGAATVFNPAIAEHPSLIGSQIEGYEYRLPNFKQGSRLLFQGDSITDMKPDLLSVLIGTNDVGRGVAPTEFESDYRFILDESRKANPELRLALLDPFVLRSGKLQEEQAWISRRGATDKLGAVVAQLAKDYNAVHIETQKVFDNAASAVSPEHWIWDGVLPLPQGHELIARSWIQEVGLRWPKE